MYNKNKMDNYEKKWKSFISEDYNPNSPSLQKTLSQFFQQIQDQPEDLIDLYKKSLANDIRLNGAAEYKDYTVEDFVEDYENFIGNKY